MNQKEIGWAYPSSEWAKGYPKGCFVVTLPGKLKKAGFATWHEAKTFADTMPEPWGKYSMAESAN